MALSLSEVPMTFSLLTNSLSSDESVRKPAEATLVQLETRPGFCSCLMEIIGGTNSITVRLSASVYFKNSINRYWRTRRDSQGLDNEEKAHLKKKLLSHLREENYQIALTLAVVISKIARFDYPKEWPELFQVLAQQLQSADVLSSHRIFLILFQTLKELSTKRLASGQKTFAEISSHLFNFCWQLWQCDVQAVLQDFSTLLTLGFNSDTQQHRNELYLKCERWLLCSKIIRQLVISGFPSDAKSVKEVRPVIDVCPLILNAIQSLLPYYSTFQKGDSELLDFLKRACTKLMKVLIVIQETHPYSFSDKSVLPPVMLFCLNKIAEPDPDLLSFQQFLIQCMVMVKSILECKEYKRSVVGRVMEEHGATPEQVKKNISNAVNDVLASLLTSERVVLLCNVLIRRYFVLTPKDIEEWSLDPEAFHHEQDMIQWTEKLRPCAEALYIVLFHNHSELLGPVVVSVLQEAMSGCPISITEITPALLLKEAAYGAAAYVYYELSNYLSFKDWFNGALSVDLSNNHPSMRIIYRKIALIFGQWVSEVKDDTKRPVYCALIRLLQDKDLSVRLAACRSLCLHVEDANFSERDFTDLLPILWDLCFELIEEVKEFDSKVQVLHLISTLTENVNGVLPFADKLVMFFQKVWEESSGESLLKIQLLVTLRNFVAALGNQSPICYSMLLPILQEGININGPDELNLLEDSILLWEATLSNAPSMNLQLLTFFPCLVNILERNFDHLEVGINIMEDYIILGGIEFLHVHSSNVARLLDLIVGNVNDRGLLSIFPVIDTLIQCCPMDVPPLIGSTLQKLIVICLCVGEEYDPSKAGVKASAAAIFARILVTNTNYLAQLTSDPSLSLVLQNSGVSIGENILLALVDVWLDKVDNVSSIQKKTYGLALSTVLKLGFPQILDKLDQILSVCTSVILGSNDDISEEESSGDNMSSSRPHGEDATPSREYRRRQIKFLDPVNQLSLEASVRENLQSCAALHGESFNLAISSMHPSALAQLKQALKMT